MDIISFDESKYFLGALCRHSHDYCETSFSLRYLKCNQRCVECLSKTTRSYQQSEKGKKAVNRYRQSEKGKATKRRHAKSEKGKAARLRHEKTEKRKQSRQAYNQSEKAKQTQQLYNQSQKRKEAYRRLNQTEKRKEYNRRFQKTEQGKAIAQINNSRRRSRKRQNPQIPYTATQIKTLKQEFDNCCAYCGIKFTQLTIDHVMPIALGGADALHNLLPCCIGCNRSKGDAPVEKWYLSQPFFSQERYNRILRERPMPEAPLVNARRKLYSDEVASIRKLWSEGATYDEIAQQFNISKSTVGRIIRGESHKSR